MTVKETYRKLLTVYPTIFTCPLDISCHLFCVIGNGYEWKNGELVENFSSRGKFEGFKKREYKGSERLENKFRLEDEAKEIKYKFILQNIEDVLKCPVDTDFFKTETRNGFYQTKPCVEYAKVLNFPDDITKDWAQAVYDFLNWWLVNLNQHYMVGSKGETTHWPKEIVEAYDIIRNKRDQISKILGHYQWKKGELEEIIDEVIRESKL